MNVVLEGPDGGGKSTLAGFLAAELGIAVKHSGGPSKFPGEIALRTLQFLNDPIPRIYDRHPVISQNIYNMVLGRPQEEDINPTMCDLFYTSRPVIIYCRPMKNVLDHKVSEFTPDEAHNHKVDANYAMLLKYYDHWAKHHAFITFRIGDDMHRIADAIRGVMQNRPFNPMRDVTEFHKKFGIEYTGKPRMLPADLQDFRERFLDEELNEYKDAITRANHELDYPSFDCEFDDRLFRQHMEKALDALVDLAYVLFGTAQLHGFNIIEAWRRVHHANMQKVKGRTKRGDSKNDIGKPPGWIAPSHADLVRGHAHLQKTSVDAHAGLVQVRSA